MTGQHQRRTTISAGVLQQLDRGLRILRIQSRGRLIREDQGRSRGQSASDRDSLLLAHALPFDPGIGPIDAEPREKLIGFDRMVPMGDSGEEHRGRHVLPGGESGQQMVGLEDHSDCGRSKGIPGRAAQTDQLIAGDPDRSSVRVQESGRQKQQGALPTAARAGEQDLLPRGHREFGHHEFEAFASVESEFSNVQGCGHADMLRPEAGRGHPGSSFLASSGSTERQVRSGHRPMTVSMSRSSPRPTGSSSSINPPPFFRFYLGGRYIWLLTAMMMLLIVGPLIGRFDVIQGGLFVGDFLLGLVLLAAAATFFASRTHFVVCLALAAIAVGCGGVSRMVEDSPALILSLIGHSAETCLLGYMTLLIGGDIFTTDEVDTDTICGSISVYLLIAALFAVVYTMIKRVDPSSFQIPTDLVAVDSSLGPDRLMAYFSITTITTLGYGDITPRASLARSISNLEALIGQIYLTVLVARLVGRNITRSVMSKQMKVDADAPRDQP